MELEQRVTSTTSKLANLFSGLYLRNSPAQPLASFSDPRHRVELILLILEQSFHKLSNGRPISFHGHLGPTLGLNATDCTPAAREFGQAEALAGDWRVGNERRRGIYASLTSSVPV